MSRPSRVVHGRGGEFPVRATVEALSESVSGRYQDADYPALRDQALGWARSRPLAGLRILDATPVFTNTLAKYWALCVAGAEVLVSDRDGLPADPHVLARLPELGVPIADADDLARGFDIVLDCAGLHADVPSRLGFVELTRSGVERYSSCGQPVFVADAGRIKTIETSLGTGDGFVRALSHLGSPLLPGSRVLVVGGGKVGTGICHAASRAGATVAVADVNPQAPAVADLRVDPADTAAMARAIDEAWCVVAATGHRDALDAHAAQLLASGALLANMGATDEFGPEVPEDRALNAKRPLNFVLDEPTLLRYLDPTLALSNYGALSLVNGECGPGPQPPPTVVEDRIIKVVMQEGAVAGELRGLWGLAHPQVRP